MSLYYELKLIRIWAIDNYGSNIQLFIHLDIHVLLIKFIKLINLNLIVKIWIRWAHLRILQAIINKNMKIKITKYYWFNATK